MNLDRLGLFLKVVETGSVTQAAELVHLTQPAVSRNIKLLEEDLGADLFTRKGRRLVLTATGRALVPRAQALVRQAEELAASVSRVAEREYFDLRLGTVDSVATYLLPHVIGPLRDGFPDLELKLRTGRTTALVDSLMADELDLIIVAWKGLPELDSARVTRVGPYLRRYRGRRDRFAELAGCETEEQVQQFPVVEMEALPGQPTMIRQDASSWAITFSLASVKSLVLGGFGVGSLLDFMVTPAENDELVAAAVPPEEDCHLLVIGGPAADNRTYEAIEETVAATLSRRLAP